MNIELKGRSQTLCSKSYDRLKKIVNLKFLRQKYNTFCYSVIASKIQNWNGPLLMNKYFLYS